MLCEDVERDELAGFTMCNLRDSIWLCTSRNEKLLATRLGRNSSSRRMRFFKSIMCFASRFTSTFRVSRCIDDAARVVETAETAYIFDAPK